MSRLQPGGGGGGGYIWASAGTHDEGAQLPGPLQAKQVQLKCCSCAQGGHSIKSARSGHCFVALLLASTKMGCKMVRRCESGQNKWRNTRLVVVALECFEYCSRSARRLMLSRVHFLPGHLPSSQPAGRLDSSMEGTPGVALAPRALSSVTRKWPLCPFHC